MEAVRHDIDESLGNPPLIDEQGWEFGSDLLVDDNGSLLDLLAKKNGEVIQDFCDRRGGESQFFRLREEDKTIHDLAQPVDLVPDDLYEAAILPCLLVFPG